MNLREEFELIDSPPATLVTRSRLPTRHRRNLKVMNKDVLYQTTNTHASYILSDVSNTPKLKRPPNRPKETLDNIITQLGSSNWDVTITGLQNLRQLIKTNPDAVEDQVHSVATLIGKLVKNLRSQVARSACSVTTDMFSSPKKLLETVSQKFIKNNKSHHPRYLL